MKVNWVPLGIVTERESKPAIVKRIPVMVCAGNAVKSSCVMSNSESVLKKPPGIEAVNGMI